MGVFRFFISSWFFACNLVLWMYLFLLYFSIFWNIFTLYCFISIEFHRWHCNIPFPSLILLICVFPSFMLVWLKVCQKWQCCFNFFSIIEEWWRSVCCKESYFSHTLRVSWGIFHLIAWMHSSLFSSSHYFAFWLIMCEPYFETIFTWTYDYPLVLKGTKDNSSNRNNALTVTLLLKCTFIWLNP